MSALLLAAGKAERMGRTKQLLPVGDQSMVESSLQNLQKSRVDEIVVILGFAAERIRPIVNNQYKVKVAVNTHFDEGAQGSARDISYCKAGP